VRILEQDPCYSERRVELTTLSVLEGRDDRDTTAPPASSAC
jgi:hypothetical protein